MSNKVILCIVDGFGIGEKNSNNPLFQTSVPFLQKILKDSISLNASEKFVGLVNGQMGNSEVGHMTVGSGRITEQSLTKIHNAIENHTLFKREAFGKLIEYLQKFTDGSCHMMILLSDGGVHSHINHLIYTIENFPLHRTIFLHIITDGRDVGPKSALRYVHIIQNTIEKFPHVKIATVSGRYYAMDRNKNFDRTQKAYDAIVIGKSDIYFKNVNDLMENFYKDNITDEFFSPSCNSEYKGIRKNDAVLMLNFRPDRMRQIASQMEKTLTILIVSMIEYFNENTKIQAIFQKEKINQTLGEILSLNNKKQLRIAETEKYAHVTYFFNCGVETPYENEDRIMIPSPSVATYDLQPEMSAYEITNTVIEEMLKYDFICINFANADMVGHTGNLNAAIKACETLNDCLEKIQMYASKNNYNLLITSDHGNIERMSDEKMIPHTAHTLNKVPFICFSNKEFQYVYSKNSGLQDVAPTVLHLMNIAVPEIMTGKSLIKFI